MFWNGVSIVWSVFLIVGIGMLLTHLKWFTEPITRLFSKLVVNVGLPAMAIYQMVSQYDRAHLLAALPSLAVGYVSIALLYMAALPIARLFRIPQNRVGVFRAMFSFGNTIFIGLPISQALFGDEALPATLMYYMANTTLFWTLGANGIQLDGGAARAGFSWASCRRMLTPPLMALFFAIACILIGLPLPSFVLKAANYIGNIVTPISLFFVGSMLYGMLRQGLRWERGYGVLLLGRFVLSPVLIALLGAAAGSLSPLWASTYLVQASMPVQTSCAIVAHSYNADAEYATGAVTLSTLLSTLSIPLFSALAGLLYAM